MKSGEMNHFILETRALDDVGRAYDLVRSRKLPLALSLGQRSNDCVTSLAEWFGRRNRQRAEALVRDP
jgi:hypothetical protein